MRFTALIKGSRLTALLLAAAFYACASDKSSGHGDRKHDKKKALAVSDNSGADSTSAGASSMAEGPPAAAAGCQPALWDHVYDPSRLTKLEACVAVTGTVVESAADDDGDQHFLIRLDPGQEALVNQVNRSKKNGNLVIEIVCANPVALKKAKSACAGYSNDILLAPVGAHIKATGTFVIDSHNGWNEIHPVSLLQRF